MALKLYFVLGLVQLSSVLATAECYTHNMIKKCRIQDSDCLIEKSNAILKDFTNGIPDLGIEKLDKMSIDSKEFKVDGTIQEINNVQVEGLSNATINDITFFEDLKLVRLSFDTTIVISFDYVLEGFLFMQPIVGEGQAYIKIKNLQSDMLFFYDIVKKGNGKHMLKLIDYRFGVHIKDSTEYHYANLYNGDEKRTKLVNRFLNKNWTIITKVYGTDFYDIIYNKIFKAVRKYFRSEDLEDVILLE